MDVSAVPFPGDAFEAAAAELRPCLVVVDVTYLDEARVRPLMIDRFSRKGPVLVFASESGHAWSDDLDSGLLRADGDVHGRRRCWRWWRGRR